MYIYDFFTILEHILKFVKCNLLKGVARPKDVYKDIRFIIVFLCTVVLNSYKIYFLYPIKIYFLYPISYKTSYLKISQSLETPRFVPGLWEIWQLSRQYLLPNSAAVRLRLTVRRLKFKLKLGDIETCFRWSQLLMQLYEISPNVNTQNNDHFLSNEIILCLFRLHFIHWLAIHNCRRQFILYTPVSVVKTWMSFRNWQRPMITRGMHVFFIQIPIYKRNIYTYWHHISCSTVISRRSSKRRMVGNRRCGITVTTSSGEFKNQFLAGHRHRLRLQSGWSVWCDRWICNSLTHLCINCPLWGYSTN